MQCDSLSIDVVYMPPGMAAAELKRQNKHGIISPFDKHTK